MALPVCSVLSVFLAQVSLVVITIDLSFDKREKNGNDIVYIIVVFIGLSRGAESTTFYP